MIEPQLFIGFPLDEKFEEALKQANPYVVSWLIQEEDPNYLQYGSYGQKRYLGKKTEPVPDFDTLELLQSNVYSLLRRMVSHYPYEKTSLYVFPINPGE